MLIRPRVFSSSYLFSLGLHSFSLQMVLNHYKCRYSCVDMQQAFAVLLSPLMKLKYRKPKSVANMNIVGNQLFEG